jgi:exodeoxyribonuclease VII large subunit
VGQIPFMFSGRPPPPPAPEKPVVYTVSELQTRLRSDLEERYAIVLVSGEISNFQIHARSGHAYFTLKDKRAQVKCVLWRDQLIRIRHRLNDGLEVIVKGKITVYEQGGQLQLSVQTVEPQGLGARQLEFQERVEKLRKEGLTADTRKRRLPFFPRCIGIVTSKSGAALRDVMRTILRRDPFAHVLIAHAQVQGDTASFEIVQALRRLDAIARCDVILLCRGGGSIEDLWAFNEEPVARAIVACRAPVVTGIGHETDTTIADLVADLRASTPTAAAEHAVPVRSEVRARFTQLEASLNRALLRRVETLSSKLLKLTSRIKDPKTGLERRAQRLDELSSSLEDAARRHIVRRRDRLLALEKRLARLDPASKVRATEHRLKMLEQRMSRAAERHVDRARRQLAVGAGRLESLSPLACLARGYAIVRTDSGTVLKRSAEASPGETLHVRLHEGGLTVRVIAPEKPDESPETA